MSLELRLNQKLDLQLKLAPQIIQSIEILQLPSPDLERLIEQELDTNDFLEVRSDTVSDDGSAAEAATPTKAEEPVVERAAELERLEREGVWDEEMPRFKSALNYEASDRKHEAMNNTADRGPSLHEYLLDQFTLLDLDERFRELGRAIIENIDANGRLARDLDEIVAEHPDCDLEDAEYVLGRIQSLEPRGIAARDTRECLLLQLDEDDPQFELKRALISDHLEDLAKNRRPKIAKALGISLQELEELVHELSELDISPGRTAVDEEPHYIYPDVIVDWTPDGYEVRLADSPYRSLRVSPDYRKIIKDKRIPDEYKDQVKKQVDSAKWLISAIEQRQETLLRVAERIVYYQRDFLDFGPHYLRPLKMQQIADDLGIHVSTVSRATHEKYMQTHRGIFSMKYFFSGATTNVDGGVESRASVKQRVKEIIDQEDKTKPLSDEEIVQRLKDAFGVEVARRTVTKYRKALGIPSTRQRRVYV